MKKLSILFLILSGCAAPTTKFDANFKFCELEGKQMVCLSQEKLEELREILIRCKACDH